MHFMLPSLYSLCAVISSSLLVQPVNQTSVAMCCLAGDWLISQQHDLYIDRVQIPLATMIG
jgi:hypothetical protein